VPPLGARLFFSSFPLWQFLLVTRRAGPPGAYRSNSSDFQGFVGMREAVTLDDNKTFGSAVARVREALKELKLELDDLDWRCTGRVSGRLVKAIIEQLIAPDLN
jgi:hypothetical protein